MSHYSSRVNTDDWVCPQNLQSTSNAIVTARPQDASTSVKEENKFAYSQQEYTRPNKFVHPGYGCLQQSTFMPHSSNSQCVHLNYHQDQYNIAMTLNDLMPEPKIVIVTQPPSKFRFRYSSEKPHAHGTLSEGIGKQKQFPSVKILNYNGSVKVTASLVTTNNHIPHVHRLVGANCKNGVCEVIADANTDAVFKGMGIESVARKEYSESIRNRIRKEKGSQCDEKEITRLVKEESDQINLNVVCLRFDAFAMDKGLSFKDPIFSESISNLKSTQSGELKICRMSRFSGVCSGYDEVYLLCEKVKKDDIKVRFFERDNNGIIVWERYAEFTDKDVHRQVAIVFKTPPYRKMIDNPVKVGVQLIRPSDDECSDEKEFVYLPNADDLQLGHKKRRLETDLQDCSSYPIVGSVSPSLSLTSDPEHLTISNNFNGQNQTTENDLLQMLGEIENGNLNAIFGNQASTLDWSFNPTHSNAIVPDSKAFRKSSITVGRQIKQESDLKLWNDMQKSFSALHKFAISGQIIHLLERYRNIIGLEDNNKENIIFHAIKARKHAVAVCLIRAVKDYKDGIIINRKNQYEQTALHLAVLTKSPLIMSYLLQSDCNVFLFDMKGNTALHLASSKLANEDLFTFMTSTDYKKFLGIIDIRNHEGLTPLHLAVLSNQNQNASTLLMFGADVNASDGNCGNSALHFALENSNFNLVELLLNEENVDVNLRNDNGDTPLHFAVLKSAPESIIEAMLEKGADPLICNNEYKTSENEDENSQISGISVLDHAFENPKIFNLLKARVKNEESIGDASQMLPQKKMDVPSACSLPLEDEGYSTRELNPSINDASLNKLARILEFHSDDFEELASKLEYESKLKQSKDEKNTAKSFLTSYVNDGRNLEDLCDAFVSLKIEPAKKLLKAVIKK